MRAQTLGPDVTMHRDEHNEQHVAGVFSMKCDSSVAQSDVLFLRKHALAWVLAC